LCAKKTGQEFFDCAKAAKEFGLRSKDVNDVCNGRQRTTKGMAFYYKENGPPSYVGLPHGGNPPKIVQCVQTGEVFPSIWQAAKALGLGKNEIGKILSGKRKTSKGLSFVTIDTQPALMISPTPC
jgi:plasmid maintenance system antidote protein VapI